MSDTFDPYHKWLSIPPHQQPPNHYRLLGINGYESDPEVIANAADRLMKHLRTFQVGERSQLSQKLLNEVANAKICLLDQQSKAQYDAELVAQSQAQKNALEDTVAPPPQMIKEPFVEEPAKVFGEIATANRASRMRGQLRGKSSEKNTFQTTLAVAGLITAAGVLLFMWLLFRGGSDKEVERPQKIAQRTTQKNPRRTKSAVERPQIARRTKSAAEEDDADTEPVKEETPPEKKPPLGFISLEIAPTDTKTKFMYQKQANHFYTANGSTSAYYRLEVRGSSGPLAGLCLEVHAPTHQTATLTNMELKSVSWLGAIDSLGQGGAATVIDANENAGWQLQFSGGEPVWAVFAAERPFDPNFLIELKHSSNTLRLPSFRLWGITGSGTAEEMARAFRDRIRTAAPMSNAQIPADAVEWNGHYYKVYAGGVPHSVAQKQCEMMGGHLARIQNPGEQRLLTRLIANGKRDGYWLDGSDVEKEGLWKFSDGSPMKYFAWGAIEPNNGYGRSGGQNALRCFKDGSWDDESGGSRRFGFICEWDGPADARRQSTNGHPLLPDGIYTANFASMSANDVFIVRGNSIELTESFSDGGPRGPRSRHGIIKQISNNAVEILWNHENTNEPNGERHIWTFTPEKIFLEVWATWKLRNEAPHAQAIIVKNANNPILFSVNGQIAGDGVLLKEAQEQTARIARVEAKGKAREEAERRAKQDAERKAREEASPAGTSKGKKRKARIPRDAVEWNALEPKFNAHTISKDAYTAHGVFAADVDSDGDTDVLSATYHGGKIAWYENDGSQNFVPHIISTDAHASHCVYASDIDGDGDTDVLSASYVMFNGNGIAWYENDGRENFTAHVVSKSNAAFRCVFAIDVDSDGDTDILSASANDHKITLYENDGQEIFTAQLISSNAIGAHCVFAEDLDGDGDIDILSASAGDHKITWYENRGHHDFRSRNISTNAVGANSVFVRDVDGDGDFDVLSSSFGDNKIAWYENDGNQHFVAHTISTDHNNARSVFACDIDKDGDTDVISASSDDTKVAWHENDGQENFRTHIISKDTDAVSMYVADVDDDGDPDVLTASYGSGMIKWHENQQATTSSKGVARDESTEPRNPRKPTLLKKSIPSGRSARKILDDANLWEGNPGVWFLKRANNFPARSYELLSRDRKIRSALRAVNGRLPTSGEMKNPPVRR